MKIVSAGIRNELSTAELFELLKTGHRVSVYQIRIHLFTSQLTIPTYPKMTNCEPFRTKYHVKIVAMLTIDIRDIFLIKM